MGSVADWLILVCIIFLCGIWSAVWCIERAIAKIIKILEALNGKSSK